MNIYYTDDAIYAVMHVVSSKIAVAVYGSWWLISIHEHATQSTVPYILVTKSTPRSIQSTARLTESTKVEHFVDRLRSTKSTAQSTRSILLTVCSIQSTSTELTESKSILLPVCTGFPRLLEIPGKSWIFFLENSRTWKVLEKHFGPGKSWKNILEDYAIFIGSYGKQTEIVNVPVCVDFYLLK